MVTSAWESSCCFLFFVGSDTCQQQEQKCFALLFASQAVKKASSLADSRESLQLVRVKSASVFAQGQVKKKSEGRALLLVVSAKPSSSLREVC